MDTNDCLCGYAVSLNWSEPSCHYLLSTQSEDAARALLRLIIFLAHSRVVIVAFDLHGGARVALVAGRIRHLFEQLIDTCTVDCTRLNECIDLLLVGECLPLAFHHFYLFD